MVMVRVADLLVELKLLRKGRGVQADLAGRLGPGLLRISGISDADSPPERRTKLLRTLNRANRQLPPDMLSIVEAGLCLDQKARMRTLEERLAWSAEQFGVSHRTIARRLDEGLSRLAEVLADAPADRVETWYIQELSTILRLDTDRIEAIERRRIVSLVDGLTELDTFVSVPRERDDALSTHDLEVDVLQGGLLEAREQPYESSFRNVISLPSPLNSGDRHEYILRFRIPPGQPMAPHYMHVPMRRSERFDLRIRFARPRPPTAVWRLDGVPTAVIYERGPGSDILTLDRVGEVYAGFGDLKQGFAYGIRWQF